MNYILFASNNFKKVKEARAILGSKLKSLEDLKIKQEIKENANSFKENSLLKARVIKEKFNLKIPIFADDSGIEIKALNGEPGIYSKRFYSLKTGKKFNQEENNKLILSLMKGKKEREARFVCCIALILPSNQVYTFEEYLNGYIAEDIIEGNNFAYNSIFILEDKRRMSLLSLEEKNKISHRGLALEKLKLKLTEKGFL